MASIEFLTRAIGLNTPEIGVGSDAYINLLYGDAGDLNERDALGISAVWQAVNMISETMAVLPLKVFRDVKGDRKEDTSNPLYPILHDQVNSITFLTSFMWRKMMMQRLLLDGRAFSYIEENAAGRVKNIYYLDPNRMQVTIPDSGLGREYHYTQPSGVVKVYQPAEIIDLVWVPEPDGVRHLKPISVLRHTLRLSAAATKYANKLFSSGGAPQLVASGPLTSPEASARASKMMQAALENMTREGRGMMIAPDGWKIDNVGFDPMKSQLLELRKFQTEEIARLFNVSPSLLMDMSSGTFNNVEQQDIAFAKHCVHHWTERWESELNCKLVGPRNKNTIIEFSLDGLQRGDFVSRGAGLAQRIQNGLLTPNEGRALDNLPPLPGGDQLLVQGAIEPIEDAGKQQAQPKPVKPLKPPAPPPEDDSDNDQADQS